MNYGHGRRHSDCTADDGNKPQELGTAIRVLCVHEMGGCSLSSAEVSQLSLCVGNGRLVTQQLRA